MTRTSMPILLAALLAPAAIAAADEPPTYERDVGPILAKRCAACHNAKKLDDPDLSGGLALDSFEAATRGTAEHRVIEPGKPDASELYRRLVDPDEDRRMPMLDDPLPEPQTSMIRAWIAAGAPRGMPVARPATTPKAPTRAARTLDVVLSSPKKDGPAIALKVGPLPAVGALAFRGDGRLLAIGTSGRVVLWDLDDQQPAAVLGDLPGPIHALAFSRDGRRLALGAGLPARSGSVRVYAVPGGALLHDFEGHTDAVYAVALRPDGRQLASAGYDQTVRTWSLVDGRPLGVFTGHSSVVDDLAYTPDGHSLISAGKDGGIRRIDAETAQGARTYSDHEDEVLALAVRPDGSGFVTSGMEPQLRWWSLDRDKPTRKVGGHSGPVHALAFSGDGRHLISAGGDGTVRLWDGASGTFRRRLPGPTDWQYAVALSADGHLAAAAGWDGLVRLWDTETGALQLTLIVPPSDQAHATSWLALAPDGHWTASDDLRELVRVPEKK